MLDLSPARKEEPKCPFCGGRPFIVDGKNRFATSLVFEINEANARTSWKYDQVPKTPGNDSLNNAIAMKFANQGEGEHASIASFARHTFQLMTMGAPPTL